MIVSELRDRLIGKLSHAYKVNDRAHQIGHFNAVDVCGNEINNRLQLGYDPKLIMLVAYTHDLFAWSRVNHHILSYQFVLTSDISHYTELDSKDRLLVAAGCMEHRASRKEGFTSEFAKLMNCADRELPGDVHAMLERAIQYRLDDICAEDTEVYRAQVMPDAVAHIKEKFGAGGYASYPDLYIQCFERELAQQREDIKNL